MRPARDTSTKLFNDVEPVSISPGQHFGIQLVKQLRARFVTPEAIDFSDVARLLAKRIDDLLPGCDVGDCFELSPGRLEEEIILAVPWVNWDGLGPYQIWGYVLFSPTDDDHLNV